MNRKVSLVICGLLLALVSCRQFSNPFAGEKVLAEAGNATLYERDVVSIYTPEMSSEDSAKILKSYVDQWVKMQLKIQEAEQMFHSSQDDIDKMVEEYRNSLLIHKLDQYCVDRQLDTLFTDEQVKDYYEKNKKTFILDKTVLKARMVRVPKTYRQSAKLKELMLSSRDQDYQDFVELCAKNGFELVELNQWTEMPALLALLPVSRNTNYDYVLTEGKIHEFSNQDSKFFVRTLGSRQAGDYAPLESVTDVIRRMVFNARRQEIIRRHEDSLYREASADKDIVVNIN